MDFVYELNILMYAPRKSSKVTLDSGHYPKQHWIVVTIQSNTGQWSGKGIHFNAGFGGLWMNMLTFPVECQYRGCQGGPNSKVTVLARQVTFTDANIIWAGPKMTLIVGWLYYQLHMFCFHYMPWLNYLVFCPKGNVEITFLRVPCLGQHGEVL